MRAVPAPVVARAERLARVHPLEAVAEITGVHRTTLYRLRSRGWRPGTTGPAPRPLPSDFAIQAKGMTSAELSRHYRAGTRAVARWLREKQPRPAMRPGPRSKRS